MLFRANLLTHAFLNFYLEKGIFGGNKNIYITANNIYLGQELCLGDRVVCSSLLGKRLVTTPFAERHFSSVLWPLARDVQRITYIALALDIHVL